MSLINKNTKTVASVVTKFTKEFEEIANKQAIIANSEKEKMEAAAAKMEAAEKEKSLAEKAVEGIKAMLGVEGE